MKLPREPGVVEVSAVETGHDCWSIVYFNEMTGVKRVVQTVNGKKGLIVQEWWVRQGMVHDAGMRFDTYEQMLAHYGEAK